MKVKKGLDVKYKERLMKYNERLFVLPGILHIALKEYGIGLISPPVEDSMAHSSVIVSLQ